MARGGTHYESTGRYGLTDRQAEVLRLVARGLTNAEIAQELGITLDGAKFHVSEILGKLGVATREGAAERWRAESRPAARARRWLAALFFGTAAKFVAGALATLAVGAVVVAVILIRGSDSPAANDVQDTSPTAAASPVVPITRPIGVGGQPDSLVELAGDVWVGNQTSREVVRLDGSTGAIEARIAVNSRWLKLGGGAGSLWVGAPELDQVLRIDPATNKVVAAIPFPRALGLQFAFAGGYLWVARPLESSLARLDPSNNRVVSPDVPVAGQATALASDGTALWLMTANQALTSLDARTGTPLKSYDPKMSADLISASGGAVWLAGKGYGITRLDPATGTFTRGPGIPDPRGLFGDATGAWVTSFERGALVRVGPDAKITAATAVGSQPGSVVEAGGAVWVTTREAGAVERLDRSAAASVVTVDVLAPLKNPAPPLDYIGLVKFNGVTYFWQRFFGAGPNPPPVPVSLAGPVYDRVLVTLRDEPYEPNRVIQDGDSTTLPAGSPLYELNGYDPRTRLAARVFFSGEESLMVFEAAESDTATRGADLLDIAGRVSTVAIYAGDSPDFPPKRLASITDPVIVERLVELLLASAYDADRAREVAIDPNQKTFTLYGLVLEMRDTTTISRSYRLEANMVYQSLVPAPEFADIIKAAIALAP